MDTHSLTAVLPDDPTPGSAVGAQVVIPSSDSLLAVLATRYRVHAQSTTRIGDSLYVSLNPFQPTADASLASQREYEDRACKLRDGKGGDVVQPHVYELACRVYLLMKRTGESQSVVFSGLSGAGSSTQRQLLTSQLVLLSTSPSSKKDLKLTNQLHALESLLSAFGSAKTSLNPSASRHSTFLELHFANGGKLLGAKVLAFGLDKTRVMHLAKDERTYNVFYQLLAGASADERKAFGLLDDLTSYALFQSSGCYHLPHAPNSDDSIAFEDLKASLNLLGFKPRHVASIFRLLSAILLLGNLTFLDPDPGRAAAGECATVEDREALAIVSSLLGLAPADLERGLTNRVRWVRKEVTNLVLHAAAAAVQRDQLVASLYAIIFAFVIETANHKLFPDDDAIVTSQSAGGSSILLLDIPGFQSHAHDRPTSSVLLESQNGFEEFAINFQNEVVHSWLSEIEFDGDSGMAARAQEDGVRLADVIPPSGLARLELLRGGRVGGKADRKPGGLLGGLSKTCGSVRKGAQAEEADESLMTGMREHYGTHTSFLSNPSGPASNSSFGIVHFGGQKVVYDTRGMIEHNLDALDAEFVALFRASEDGFVAKLFSGPSLAAEVHPLDENTVVAAQVSNAPLRRPSPVVSPLSVPASPGIDFTAPLIDPLEIHPLSTQLNATLAQLLNLMERTRIWAVLSLRPNDVFHPGTVDTKRLKAQIGSYLLPELVARKKNEFVYDATYAGFAEHHSTSLPGREGVEALLASDGGLREGVDYALGTSRVWLSYNAWRTLEDRVRILEPSEPRAATVGGTSPRSGDASPGLGSGGLEFAQPLPSASRSTFGGDWMDLGTPTPGGPSESADDLLWDQQEQNSPYRQWAFRPQSYAFSETAAPYATHGPGEVQSDVWGVTDKEVAAGFGGGGGGRKEAGLLNAQGELKSEAMMGKGATVEELPTSRGRRWWVFIVWMLTWWIPSFLLKHVGRMKRPDVRLAWREKVALCMLIGTFCGLVIFYIVVFGKLLCPNMNKAWDEKEISYHSGASDYWVSVRGVVYDLTKFYKLQHSDITGESVTTDDMLTLGGLDLTDYFPIPLTTACPTLVTDKTLSLQFLNFTAEVPTAVHTSGSQQTETGSELYNADWYTATFLPKMENYKKGPKVWSRKKVRQEAESLGRYWAVYEGKVYDLTDYFNTITLMSTQSSYEFLDSDLSALWQAQAGDDITSAVKDLNLDADTLISNLDCISTLFYQGELDFRLTPRCQLQPNLLLAFSMVIVATMLAKFLAALQLGSKKTPELRDKFVICQVPCYTEGEESLKKTIDSLATVNYDDKRKLLLIICDGMIIGAGNDRPTPRIVLDILGVDQGNDPEPLMFKSVSEGSKQLNYGKIWSGLYEVEGHVVPYIVVAKILAMRFLNRVHFDSEMYPLELEMYHQIKNVIGVDPQLYEYMLVIDADTSVEPDSLNRLVSAAADDSRIIGICGETRLENEQASWWTMIQVYEYFISHHMAKAFESLFGTVTCLPGCFTMYRLRSADKGKPLLISSLVIDDYSECNLDTLHKKNLLALGEDRYLTTLILKHFPNFKTKFTGDAHASTVAPDRWSVLLSQRRRWINSTVHNLAELMFLPDMCGFCCFGMRFIVVIDLIGTLILPATFVYLIYLIVTVATGSGAIPVISLALIAAAYGLQAIIFLLKRQWQLIGWLVIYLLAYPIYSFVLPVYSFWCFDDFTWGSTRVVVGEGSKKKVLSNEDEAFDEDSIPTKKFADYVAALEADDNDDTRSVVSRSTAGFSMATKLPPGSYRGGPDYYRDTHARGASKSTINHLPPVQPMPSFGGYGAAGSMYGSDFGMPNPAFAATAHRQSQTSMAPPPASLPRRDSTFSAFTSYGGPGTFGSMYSLNPFTTPNPTGTGSLTSSPTDDELVVALRGYLASHDLMSVTKRSAREGLAALFPNADLTGKRDFINGSIDHLMSGGV